MKYCNLFIVIIILLSSCTQKEKANRSEAENSTEYKKSREVLLIGTFHYNNPGADVAKTKSFDILNDKSQKELDFISDKIAAYKPTKIFVEWDYDEQKELDSLYTLYLEDRYFANDDLSDFYKKNEIFQLAFRTAKKAKVNGVIGVDYKTDFPFDSLMSVIAKNKQVEIQTKIEETIEFFTKDFDDKIDAGESLLNLTYHLNSYKLREISNHFHNEMPLLVGDKNNFIGPYLSSEWYRRNLYMWSLIQKGANTDDERIMVLAGASHAAMFKQLIDQDNYWKVVELQSIVED